jgi:hypothetical protein
LKIEKFQPVIRHLPEPLIQVGEKVEVPEPKMGLTLVGPFGKQSTDYEINLGLVGDTESLEKTRNLLQRLSYTTRGKSESFLHATFPGLGGIRIVLKVKWEAEIDGDSIRQQLQKTALFSERVEISSRILNEKIKGLAERDPAPDVILVAYPSIVDLLCIEGAIGQRGVPHKSKLEKEIEKARAVHISLDSFVAEASQSPTSFKPVDLRSLLKVASMECQIPIQILRPVTTEPYNPDRPRREDDATTFWNLVVALFYKSNRLPWRVAELMQDTCYLGVSFFRDRGDSSSVRTALAQVFSIDAEGYVFRGEKATIDENNSPHVSAQEASTLAKYAIEVYTNNKGAPPSRVVIHKTSRFSADEQQGFKAGAGQAKLDLVAFGARSIKLIRWGSNPPIRGTMVKLPDQSVLLYTFGYIPYLGVYPGPRVPSPLEILEHHGSASMDRICSEIMALTKLNWNNAKFCTKAPITIGFARRVGEILRNSPPGTKPAEKFKFYM